MTQKTGNDGGNRFCKACGTPAEDGKLCNHCGAALDLPDSAGLIEDQGAAVRRDFEGRTQQQEHRQTKQQRPQSAEQQARGYTGRQGIHD
ncbi:hypothetical protein GCM10023086_77250 [Streptomyces venetus]|uniref:Zinc ribbon domain-containing protein n=1 Tax=Streptomyces venetus TaxID=1701086 RepID=A0ABP8HLV4_9ACTN